MSDRKYICAFTALGNDFPEYLNFYQYGEEIELTLRLPSENGSEGKTVSMRFPAVLFAEMLADANKNFTG